MVIKILIFFLILISFTLSQTLDSLSNQNFNTEDDSFSIQTDSLIVNDSTLISEIKLLPDTISPIQGEPLSLTSTIINKRTFLFTNYRYTGDLMRSFPIYFIKDQGFIGQPNESYIYGVGNNGISYLVDGVLWNNRYTNSLDLNLVQSENIDSIEIVPSPRGFLYGPYNNPVTVNFITRDFISPDPYTRIKYYEGPDGEAMIDGKFNAKMFKRMNLSVQVTNRKYDSSYTNSEFSIWQVNTKLKYFLSNIVNISAAYYFVDSRVGLNEGVDIDSISQITNDINSILYEPFLAPVVNPFQKLDVLQHSFVLRTLAKPFENSKLDLSFYYKYSQDELINYQDSVEYNSDTENKTYGGTIKFHYNYDFISLQLIGNYEKSNFAYAPELLFSNYATDDFYNIGGILTFNTQNKRLRLSLFIKDGYRKRSDLNYFGIGADLNYNLGDLFSFYAGYSIRRDHNSPEDNISTIESGIDYKDINLIFNMKYFSTEYVEITYMTGNPRYYGDHLFSSQGVGMIINYKILFLLFETNTTYYFSIKDDNLTEAGFEKPNSLPDWQSDIGIYVNDFFFENNLNLKAGFKFYYAGKVMGYENPLLKPEPSHKLDFTIAGEIQNRAIFYFVWENLFGNQYFITPYYPMPERSIRFGLAWELFN